MAFLKLQCLVLLNLHFSVVSFCVCVCFFLGGCLFLLFVYSCHWFFLTILSHNL